MADRESSPRGSSSSKGGPSAQVRSRQLFGEIILVSLILLSIGVGALGGFVLVYSSDLPKVRRLEDYRPDVITEVYADNGTLIGSFALEHRVMVTYDQIPSVLRNAVISIEDRHFESHFGVDILRIIKAGIIDLMEWRKAQGASTLTMQLSRLLFLTPQKSFRRKFQEILLALQIERQYTKQQIFTMYANQVGLGHGNYGFEAAAEFYFGKHLNQLTLPEAALLAGLPRAPTYYSPILHPEHALERRDEVLAAMLNNHKITLQQYQKAKKAPLHLDVHGWGKTIAPYFVEDIRQFLEKKYGPDVVHEDGLRVYTTLNIRLQKLAEKALRDGLRTYDKRHGWRGPEGNILKHPVELSDHTLATLHTYVNDDWKKPLHVGEYVHGLVMRVKPDYALVRFGHFEARVTPPDFAWTDRTSPKELFSPGDVDLFLVHEIKGEKIQVTLDQYPTVQGALVAIDNATGAVKAMVGGYNFNVSKFNRATQAQRQVGSSFKVYVYSEALLQGMSPFDKILDSPVSYRTSSGWWSPHDYDNKYEGWITLLQALAQSRNIPAVRLLQKVGIDKVIKLCRKFGITSRLVPNLPLALGASSLTVLEHTSAFSTFPDDGVHIAPRLIDRVTDYHGRVIDDFLPQVTDVLPPGVARLMVSMLREVINSGTGIRAKKLGLPLAGKTGTTNDFTDAWFIGFSPKLTAGVWVGYDDRRSLGPQEEGSHVALPIWMEFMSNALKGQRVGTFPYSPLLKDPEQVQQILASAQEEQFFPQREVRGEIPQGAQNGIQTSRSPATSPSPSTSTDSPPTLAPAAGKALPQQAGSSRAPAPN